MTVADAAQGEVTGAGVRTRRVWDAPIRVMHWGLVVAIAACWYTGRINELEYHHYAGYAVLFLVLLRLWWGVAGSSTARFAGFVRGPRAIAAYARTLHRRDTPHTHGHNALGAVAILAMLGLIGAVAVVGLFVVDVDGLYSGPLSSYVTFKQGRGLARWHYDLFDWLLVVIALHIVAVGFYLAWKRHNLVGPMISGRSRAHGVTGEEMTTAPAWRLLVGVLLSAAIVWAISTGFYF